jgi:hypothetical protein
MLLCRTVPTGYGLDFERLLAEMPVEQFEKWRVLYGLEPWAEERTDLAAGIGVAHNLESHGLHAAHPREYMPYLQKPEPKMQSEAEMKEAFEQVCKAREEVGKK